MTKQPRTTHKTLGHNLRTARAKNKFTVEQLAREVNMRASYIEDIENYTLTDVPADVLSRIANALGTTSAELKGIPSDNTAKKGVL